MITKKELEERKVILINLLKDQNTFLIQFIVDDDKEHYQIEFRRVGIMENYTIFIKSGIINTPFLNEWNDSGYTIDKLINTIIKPANFIDIAIIRKGDKEIAYRKSIVNDILENKKIEIWVSNKQNSFTIFKADDGWKIEYNNSFITILPWLIIKMIMDFNNNVMIMISSFDYGF